MTDATQLDLFRHDPLDIGKGYALLPSIEGLDTASGDAHPCDGGPHLCRVLRWTARGRYGYCSKCHHRLTEDNASPSVWHGGYGYCRQCFSQWHEARKPEPMHGPVLTTKMRREWERRFRYDRKAGPSAPSITNGRRYWVIPWHPLSSAKGTVLGARAVLFAKVGYGPCLCHWCNKPLQWRAPGGNRNPSSMVVDHIDEDTLNDHPLNLVPSCVTCNSSRSHRHTRWFDEGGGVVHLGEPRQREVVKVERQPRGRSCLCSGCGVELTLDNTKPSTVRRQNGHCRQCKREYQRAWKKKRRRKLAMERQTSLSI